MTAINQIFKAIMGGSGKKPSLDSMLAIFDRELENFPALIRPTPESKPRTPFDSPNLTFEQMYMSRLTLRQILAFLPVIIPLRARMSQSARMHSSKFQPSRSEAAPEFLSALEDMARSAGVANIKYVKVPRHAIFQHKGIPYEYAVVITVEMDKANLSNAPGFDAFLEVARGYGNLARIGNKLAGFMRQNGFAAYPGTALGGLTDYTHLAELAGLGVIGYHGLLITPNEGARLRINTIYTNITNLPVQAENEHLWVRDFCAMCKKCIRVCPVGAIYEQPRPRGDGGMQCIDHATCRDYFNQNYGCAVCLVQCPFSEVGYEKVKARFKGNPKAPQFRIPVFEQMREAELVSEENGSELSTHL
jgi:epoxyqueuosine reductase